MECASASIGKWSRTPTVISPQPNQNALLRSASRESDDAVAVPIAGRIGETLAGKKGEQREARQPMLAHIVARDVGQRCREMLVGGRDGDLLACRREQRRDFPPAPGPAEIQAVEMRDLAVAPVADGGGSEQGP